MHSAGQNASRVACDFIAFLLSISRSKVSLVPVLEIAKLATPACLTAAKRVLLGTTGWKDAESNIFLVPSDLETTILQSVPVARHYREGIACVSGEARVGNVADASTAIPWPRPAP